MTWYVVLFDKLFYECFNLIFIKLAGCVSLPLIFGLIWLFFYTVKLILCPSKVYKFFGVNRYNRVFDSSFAQVPLQASRGEAASIWKCNDILDSNTFNFEFIWNCPIKFQTLSLLILSIIIIFKGFKINNLCLKLNVMKII